ncbi:LysR family transcriptional regulator [Neoroseomonas oryzicola]|uniref:LysR family transcriptional regulator n=1 Tax=Neoroseomonas oryzicola TaxID=535904 RepID=A0A9X9WDS9_9PROT|nr:LysR family transcriptional regulator [Neoroseomonas oryzicola]MBR0658489.1 LysR family transcriptional regulator [Neoroseomonas oryzicola]NKE17678.1 LysR family transcriptional regulator [Neoroseomonas oryzicola]
MFEVRDLRMVRAIHEHGSLVRAARVLGIAQPALTRQLAALEARLRGPLFERSPRGVTTTDLGRAVLTDAGEILDRLDRLGRHAAEARGDQVRDLNIAAGAYIAETLGLVAASRMLSLYPRVRVRLVSANWAEVPRAVHEREATLGLLDLRGFEPEMGDGLEVERLRPQPGVFVVRPGHPLLGRAGIGLADIVAYPVVLIGRIPTAVQAPIAAARAEAKAAGRTHAAFPALIHESPTVALRALPHSDAVVAVTIAIAAPALRAGQVVALPWRDPWVSVHPGIIRLRNRALGEAEEAFLDLLRTADREGEMAASAWCDELGLPGDCT